MKQRCDDLQKKLGYTFADRALLERALTHRSWSEENIGQSSTHRWHNERLEFLGDTVLGLSITHTLCQEFPKASEGVLSRVRSRLVGTRALVEIAQALILGSYMRLGRGEEQTGGRQRPRVIGNCVEALLGAVFDDGGFPPALGVVRRLWRGHLDGVHQVGLDGYGLDPKNLLQHRTQALWKLEPRYQIISEDGPAHRPRFMAIVTVDERLEVSGDYAASKQEASRSAASRALVALYSLEE